MKRGISPIVAVVLLIAISVIAAVGLYFWVGGLTGSRNVPTPPAVITASCYGATSTTNGTLFIHNTGTKTISANTLKVEIGGSTISLTHSALEPGHTMSVSASTLGTNLTSGTKGTVWAEEGSVVPFVCQEV